MYFPVFDCSGRLARFTLTPMQVRNFRLQHPADDDIGWIAALLDREGSHLGTRVVRDSATRLSLVWDQNRAGP